MLEKGGDYRFVTFQAVGCGGGACLDSKNFSTLGFACAGLETMLCV